MATRLPPDITISFTLFFDWSDPILARHLDARRKYESIVREEEDELERALLGAPVNAYSYTHDWRPHIEIICQARTYEALRTEVERTGNRARKIIREAIKRIDERISEAKEQQEK